MSYLISQMIFSLVMAGIAGAAFGWLLHRARSASKQDELRQIVSDQDRRLTQSDSEIRMLSDDFEDLRQRSRTEIDVLKQENRQLPQVTQNLEKSQLLVRQLMQKHESQLRNVGSENASLKERLSVLTDREQLNRHLQAELDSVKLRSGKKVNGDAPEALLQSDIESDTGPDATSDATSDATLEDLAFDEPIDLAPAASDTKKPASAAEHGAGASWASAKLLSTDDVDPLDHVIEIDDKLHAEISDETKLGDDDTLDDVPDDLPLFDPVDQHDDLKQIYGIEAVTEKSLNQLGITSYSQLAELERHDIASIAEALEIVPGRIERDDWVGSARRQLEDVLEEL